MKTCLFVTNHFGGNLLGINWVKGLQQIFNKVIVLDITSYDGEHSKFLNKAKNIMSVSESKLDNLEKYLLVRNYPRNNFKVRITKLDRLEEKRLLPKLRKIKDKIGTIDIVFFWWGYGPLNNIFLIKNVFNEAKIISCLDCYPDTWNTLFELSLRKMWKKYTRIIDGYIFYSNKMEVVFKKEVNLKGFNSLVMVEPFLSDSFYNNNFDDLSRTHIVEDMPNVIFVGRGDRFYTKDRRRKKDAVGEILEVIAKNDIVVHVPSDAEIKENDNIRKYRYYTNEEMIDGTFSKFLSSFDANLVFYNEFSEPIKKQVSLGLGTRFATALTAKCPIIVSKNSTFAIELINEFHIGEYFKDIPDLIKVLKNISNLKKIKYNFPDLSKSFSFESKQVEIIKFLEEV